MSHVKEFVVEDTKFEGQRNSGTALELIEAIAQIINSTFVSNRNGPYRECAVRHESDGKCRNGFIGGAIIATNSTLDVSKSKFEDNGADFGGAIYLQSSIASLT